MIFGIIFPRVIVVLAEDSINTISIASKFFYIKWNAWLDGDNLMDKAAQEINKKGQNPDPSWFFGVMSKSFSSIYEMTLQR